MTAAELRVISTGPLATVQDLGRTGYQRFGVSISGAADRYALRLGNLLAGNDQRAAAIEVTLGGAEFEFDGETVFAVTGADLAPALNGAPVPMWQTVTAYEGDRLTLAGPAATPVNGLRAYVNVAGGIETTPMLGSRSTHVAARLGGIDGRALQSGDYLPLGPVTNVPAAGRRVPGDLLPQYATATGQGGDLDVRVVPGPQDDRFDDEATATFYGSTFTVSDRTDRMGCRLDGPAVPAIDGAHDIVSDGVVTGAIQVPADARPIVLLADRQTTGGYAKIGVVASVDLPLIAQAPPGTMVRFTRTTLEEAQALAIERMARLRDITFETAPAPRRYALAIDGVGYEVEAPLPGARGPTTTLVNGVRYTVEIEQNK